MAFLSESYLIPSQSPTVLPSNNPSLVLLVPDNKNNHGILIIPPTLHESLVTVPSLAPTSLHTAKPPIVIFPARAYFQFSRTIKRNRLHYLLRAPRNT